MPSLTGNPYLETFLLGKESGAEEKEQEIITLLKSRIHKLSCDCYECVELRICINLIEGKNDATKKME
jgi:hypothetical protein